MDLNKLGLHIHEIRNQFSYIEGNIAVLNQSMEGNASTGAFLALQGIMSGAMQVSRLLWAPRKKGKARSEELRKFLGLPEEHPLNNDDIKTIFDNCDEENEEWVKKTAGKHILYDFIGDLGTSEHKDVEVEYIFRSFDTLSKIYVYRGKGYNMESVLVALKDVSDSINKAHYHLFPDQWKHAEQTEEEAKNEADKKIN
ncbi:MAG: hypothetical protein HOH19_15180 [Kordiimonadaceae bacterium]|jgi:hypothetical protein|nr:hypothetical protein [Kordiimonadaceae bacterium]MBT6033913.1 hypothetical protein [Kordiimonadaceae bacterium]